MKKYDLKILKEGTGELVQAVDPFKTSLYSKTVLSIFPPEYKPFIFIISTLGNLEAGHSYQYAMLFNSKERLPRGFAMQYSAAFLGQKTNLMEVEGCF